MKKIFVQNLQNKFINNLIYLDYPAASFATGSIKNILYKINDQYNFDSYIFVASLLDHEILQFTMEYKHKIKCFLFHDVELEDAFFKDYASLFYHLSYKNIDTPNLYIIPNNLVNTNLFKRDETIIKDDSIVYFVDQSDTIPSNIEQCLYPNTKMKLKIFNATNYKHPQNLGALDEKDKPLILNRASYFISHNEYYEQEAVLCGCKIIRSDTLDTNQAVQLESNFIPYSTFLDKIL